MDKRSCKFGCDPEGYINMRCKECNWRKPEDQKRIEDAANAVIQAMDNKLKTIEGNFKYGAPFGELTALRQALTPTKDSDNG